MTPSWSREIIAVFRKEWMSEVRTISGLASTALYALVSVLILNAALFALKPGPILASGLLWTLCVLAGGVTLPRTFLAEEELGTGSLLRMITRPEAAYWGKALFNMVLMLVSTSLIFGLFALNTGIKIAIPEAFLLSAVFGSTAIAGTATLSGALAALSSNRATVAAAISVPLLVFLATLGVAAVSYSLGEPTKAGWSAVGGLFAYSVLTGAVGPFVYKQLWRR